MLLMSSTPETGARLAYVLRQMERRQTIEREVLHRVLPLPTAKDVTMPQNTYGSGAEGFGDTAKDQMKRVGDQAENVANRLTQQNRMAGEGMQQVAGNMRTALDKSLRDQPMATLAIAAITGFVRFGRDDTSMSGDVFLGATRAISSLITSPAPLRVAGVMLVGSSALRL
jgi:hypothetical protein